METWKSNSFWNNVRKSYSEEPGLFESGQIRQEMLPSPRVGFFFCSETRIASKRRCTELALEGEWTLGMETETWASQRPFERVNENGAQTMSLLFMGAWQEEQESSDYGAFKASPGTSSRYWVTGAQNVSESVVNDPPSGQKERLGLWEFQPSVFSAWSVAWPPASSGCLALSHMSRGEK